MKTRTYLDVVPEDKKEEISRTWGERKRETYQAAEKHGVTVQEGETFNRVAVLGIPPGFYHLSSEIVSVDDISPSHSDIGSLCSGLIRKMAAAEQKIHCVPIAASNVCAWDSAYAKNVGADLYLRDAVIRSCKEQSVILPGGETANLGEQVKKTGMSWMFTLLSMLADKDAVVFPYQAHWMDTALRETFDSIADPEHFSILTVSGIPLLHVKEKTKILLTADGTGSKSIVCEKIEDRTDIYDTLAMACDDATREGAFPIAASIGVHAENPEGINQILEHMKQAGKKHFLPLVGSVFHQSSDVSTYIMDGVVLSKVREHAAHIGKEISPGLPLVVLYEEQRSNGINLQRRVFAETFGEQWYDIDAQDVLRQLNDQLGGAYSFLVFPERKTLGSLVAKHSTPYFRQDSQMPEELLETIKLRINVSSGGISGKTRRLLEPLGLGANYTNLYDAPPLILLLQMASRVPGSKGAIPDEVAYYTWGCGNGAIIGTTEPKKVIEYYSNKGIFAQYAGEITNTPEIQITSKCLDSKMSFGNHQLVHKYTEKPLG